MLEEAFRHEFKIEINACEHIALRQRLQAVLGVDPHAGLNGAYHIRSLYFDNADNKALKEKLDGVNNREKFRIRLYNGDASFIRLEKKSKINGLCVKLSECVTQEQCGRLLEGDTNWMLHSGQALTLELYTKIKTQQLRPVTVVDYLREAFVYAPGNVRITIDSDVRTGLRSTDLFAQSLPCIRASAVGAAILEVKYDAFLPELISDLIQVNNRRLSAFSKYAVCRRFD